LRATSAWRLINAISHRIIRESLNNPIALHSACRAGTFPAQCNQQFGYIADKLEEFFGINF
jgi:hypothetical protein